MSKALEMALRLFSPKGALHEPTSRNFSALGRDELIGALQIASKDNPQGLQYLMVDHLIDKQAIEALQAHFNDGLCNAEGRAYGIGYPATTSTARAIGEARSISSLL
jgi:uncharacterized phage protein